MSAPRRLFLHVGCPKTGTTYLQSTFWRSRDSLAAQGVHLPLRRPDHFFLSLAVRESLDPASEGPDAFSVVDRLTSDLRSSTAPTTLITHETMCQATKEQAGRLLELLGDFEVHLVITARDLARQIPAEWQQMIKSRRTITYQDFLTSVMEDGPQTAYFWRAQDAADVADRWRQDLPPERVHIVTVPPSGAHPDVLLQRFSTVLGVDPAVLTPEREHVNVTLGVDQTELLRRVNIVLGDRLPVVRAGYSRVAKVHLADQVLAAQGGQRLRMPARMAPWCRERAEDIVARLEVAGYDVVGDLKDLVPAESAPGDGAAVDEGRLSQAAVEALAAMLEQRHRDLQRITRLRAALDRASRPLPARLRAKSSEALRGLRRRMTNGRVKDG